MRGNKQKLNPDKTEVLLVDQICNLGYGIPTLLDGAALPLHAQVSSLGVLLDPQLVIVARSAYISATTIPREAGSPHTEDSCCRYIQAWLLQYSLWSCQWRWHRTCTRSKMQVARLMTGARQIDDHIHPVLWGLTLTIKALTDLYKAKGLLRSGAPALDFSM